MTHILLGIVVCTTNGEATKESKAPMNGTNDDLTLITKTKEFFDD